MWRRCRRFRLIAIHAMCSVLACGGSLLCDDDEPAESLSQLMAEMSQDESEREGGEGGEGEKFGSQADVYRDDDVIDLSQDGGATDEVHLISRYVPVSFAFWN